MFFDAPVRSNGSSGGHEGIDSHRDVWDQNVCRLCDQRRDRGGQRTLVFIAYRMQGNHGLSVNAFDVNQWGRYRNL